MTEASRNSQINVHVGPTLPIPLEDVWGVPAEELPNAEDHSQRVCPMRGLTCEHWHFDRCEVGECLLENMD